MDILTMWAALWTYFQNGKFRCMHIQRNFLFSRALKRIPNRILLCRAVYSQKYLPYIQTSPLTSANHFRNCLQMEWSPVYLTGSGYIFPAIHPDKLLFSETKIVC